MWVLIVLYGWLHWLILMQSSCELHYLTISRLNLNISCLNCASDNCPLLSTIWIYELDWTLVVFNIEKIYQLLSLTLILSRRCNLSSSFKPPHFIGTWMNWQEITTISKDNLADWISEMTLQLSVGIYICYHYIFPNDLFDISQLASSHCTTICGIEATSIQTNYKYFQ